MQREEKQGTYFPVYPNLRVAKKLKTRGAENGKREKESRREDKRASYCD